MIYRKAYAWEARISFETQASDVIFRTAISGIQKDLIDQNTYAGIPESVIPILLVLVLLEHSYLELVYVHLAFGIPCWIRQR